MHAFRPYIVIFLMTVFLAACAQKENNQEFDALTLQSLRASEGLENPITNYALGTGDRVKIVIFGEDDLSGEYELDGSGYISLPLVGEFDLKGLTVREAETQIEEKLNQGYLKDPKVGVEVLNYRPFYILGEVNLPGSYPYVSGMTVLNAIALGGGYTYRADENDITILRDTDLDKTTRRASADTLVLPGDVVRVQERFF